MNLVKKITDGFSLKQVLSNQLFKHSIIYMVSSITEKAIPFLLLPVMVTYLSTSDYGIFQNYNGLQQLLMTFMGFAAMGAISVNFYKRSKDEIAVYISNFLLLGIISVLILFAVISIFHNTIYHYYELPVKWQILTILHAYLAFNFILFTTILRLEKKPIEYGIYSILRTIIEFVVGIYLIVLIGLKWEGRIAGMVASYFILFFISVLLLYRKGYIKLKIKKKYLKELLLFGLPLIPYSLSGMMRIFLDKGFITHFHGISENGIVGLAMNFGMLIYVVTFAFSSTFSPTIFEKLSNPGPNTKRILVRIIYIYSFGLMGLVIIFHFVSKFLIIKFIKPEWSAAVPFVFWILLSYAFSGIQGIVAKFIYFTEKTQVIAIISISNNLMHILLSYLLIQWLGTIGIIYALCFSAFIGMAVTWVVSTRIYPMPWGIYLFAKNYVNNK